jgi:hypothetical protein
MVRRGAKVYSRSKSTFSTAGHSMESQFVDENVGFVPPIVAEAIGRTVEDNVQTTFTKP